MTAAEWRRAVGLPPPGADRVPVVAPRPRPAHERPAPGRMNKTEAAYANRLEALKRAEQEVKSWAFEAVKLRLADGTFYTPDFLVELVEPGPLELHEVKGFWRDDARVKFKVARELFPMFRFRAFRRAGAGWEPAA